MSPENPRPSSKWQHLRDDRQRQQARLGQLPQSDLRDQLVLVDRLRPLGRVNPTLLASLLDRLALSVLDLLEDLRDQAPLDLPVDLDYLKDLADQGHPAALHFLEDPDYPDHPVDPSPPRVQLRPQDQQDRDLPGPRSGLGYRGDLSDQAPPSVLPDPDGQ